MLHTERYYPFDMNLISFELRRVIDENACKELLNQIPLKKLRSGLKEKVIQIL